MGNKEETTQPMVEQNAIFTKQVRPVPKWQYTLFELLNSLKRLGFWVLDLLLSMVLSLAHFAKSIGVGLVKFGIGVYEFFKRKCHQFRYNDKEGKISFGVWGYSSFRHGQKVNGILYFAFEILYLVFFCIFGIKSIAGLTNLGTQVAQPATTDHPAIAGDNSILILIFGLLWLLSLGVFFYIWNRNINAGYNIYRIINFKHFEEVINKNKEKAAELDAKAVEAFEGHLLAKQFNGLNKAEIEAQAKTFENQLDQQYTVYLLNGVANHTFKYLRQLKSRKAKAEKAQKKLDNFVAIRAQQDEEMVRQTEQNKAMAIAKYETMVKMAKDEVEREEALHKQEVDLPLELEKIDSKLEIFRNKTLSGTSNLKTIAKKKGHLVSELQKRHVNYVEWQSTRNNDKFGKFNQFFKVVANYDNELLFYSHYDEFKKIYEDSLSGAEKANEDNKKRAEELVAEKDAKLKATDEKFEKIYARKAEFEQKIQALKDEYNQQVEQIKANGGDEQQLLEAKTKLIEETTRLSNAARDLPSDKAIKGLYKEEIKETKVAFKRDFKYIKTNYTSETYATERVIDSMLIDYKIDYKDAVYFANCLFKEQSKEEKGQPKKFYTEEEVANKVKELEEKKAQYLEAHQDNYDGHPKTFKEQMTALLNENFHITILLLPILGIVLLTIVPLIFSVVVAFTNYSKGHIPPTQLFGWVYFDNFVTLFAAEGEFAALPQALMKTLGWTILWAFAATFSNYILGIIVALLINKKSIKLKKLWRTVFVMTIAIPQFISLLSISVLLKKNGALDQLWFNMFGSSLGFAESGHVAMTKFIIILVNIWVGIPYTILSTTGILLNIPEDLYESARVDGASTVKQFTKITMPYILFVTGPYLITQFVGNFNNFNIIYFLSNGGPKIAGAVLQVGETDILITFLYNLITSASNPQFGIASAVGIFIFMICAFVSIVMYNKSGAIKEEDQFQ
ncbi:MAG: ABC transporter permease subunit [Erysipelotrichaceae bacterium]|nr:ABC transporter permease subunit [Erysipelotrichaceae bacterium]